MDLITPTALRRGAGAALVAAALSLAPAAAFAQQQPTPGGPGPAPAPTRPQPDPTPQPQPQPQPQPGPGPVVVQPPAEPQPDPAPQPQQPPIAAPPQPGSPPATGPTGLAAKTANAAKLGKELDARLAGAFGWQWAIAQNGKFVLADGSGTARSAADNGGTPLAMQPTMRWELASLTKNVTAAATLKLLRLNGASAASSIDKWLPAGWKRGPGFDTKSVTFEHLLTHTSGIKQMLVALPEDEAAANAPNTWAGAKWVVAHGTKPGSKRAYKNMNYVLLSVLNAQLWRAVNGELKVPQFPQIPIPVDATSYGIYGLDFFNKQLFGPIGITGVTCFGDAAKAGLNYPAGATQQTKGALGQWPLLNCASNAGLRLSSIEVVRWLSHLRFGKVMHPDDVATMDELNAGWDQGWYAGGHRHGGDFTGTNQVHTCGATFTDGTAVALIVNSPLKAGSDYQCDIVRKAWQAAMP